MVLDKPLHDFLIEYDPSDLFRDLHTYLTPPIDLCVILQLVRRYQPRTFVEVGTHWGTTTLTLAEKFPEMSIVTVDPGDKVPISERPQNQTDEFLHQDEIGKLVRNLPNVKVIKESFTEIDWVDRKFEMFFIDGNHALAHVLADSHLALKMLTKPGVIIWHDYNHVKNVKLALDQLDLPIPLITLHNTHIAYFNTHAQ